jgi:hypothetical protein
MADAAAASWLQHVATPAQLRFFREEGYLYIPNAIDPTLLARLNAASDRVEAEERHRAQHSSRTSLVSAFRAVCRDDAFLELLDLPTTFPLLWDILGWNIQHCEF